MMFLDVPITLVGMTDRSKAEVAALVRQRMKTCGLTAPRLRAAADVDRKTLFGLLDGDRWPQEDTRLKIELALGWEAGSIQDLRDGKDATLATGKKAQSPLKLASDDELLAEVRRRMHGSPVDDLERDPVSSQLDAAAAASAATAELEVNGGHHNGQQAV